MKSSLYENKYYDYVSSRNFGTWDKAQEYKKEMLRQGYCVQCFSNPKRVTVKVYERHLFTH